MRKIALIFLLLFTYNTGYSQLKPLTKKELKTLIRQGIAANEKYSWKICIDSSSSKNDTLSIHLPYALNCPNFVTWYFKKNNTIYQTITKRKTYTTSSGWQEYTFEGTPVSSDDIYRIKLIYKQDKLTLNRYNKGKLIDSYEVINYKETIHNNKKTFVLTFVRQ